MPERAVHVLVLSARSDDYEYVQGLLAQKAGMSCRFRFHDAIESATSTLESECADAVIYRISGDSYRQEFGQLKEACSPLAILALGDEESEALALDAVKYGAQDYLVRGQDDRRSFCRAVRYAVERERVEEALRRAGDELELRVEERTENLKALNVRLQEQIAEREGASASLERERDFVRALLNTVDAIVIVLEADGRVKSVNRCFEIKTGRDSRSVIGCKMADLTCETDGDQESRIEAGAGGSVVGPVHDGLRTVDSSVVYVRWSDTFLYDVDGKVSNIIFTGIDITEQRKADLLTRQRLLALGHVGRVMAMGEMVTEIAHELNQPLGAIASYSDSCIRLMDDVTANRDLISEGLREIERQALRSAAIIKHIRSFSRKGSGESGVVSLDEILAEVEDLIRAEAGWNNVRLMLRRTPGLPSVWCDKVLVEQVVLNLARNAIEAMSGASGRDKELTVSTFLDEDYAALMVEDTGPGIPSSVNLFEAFCTTKSNGIGLGLAMCQSFIRSCGGEIWGENKEDCGARFVFRIPVWKEVNGENQE